METDIQTHTSENNTTLAVQVVIHCR